VTTKEIQARLVALGNENDAQFLQRFFKTAPGEYGAGDRFRGIRVPVLRALSRELKDEPQQSAVALLQSEWHEDRVLALLLWMQIFKREAARREEIYQLYIDNTARINNWDLVDISAPHIVGAWLWDKDRAPLYHLARSEMLWERRIAIISTFFFIRHGDFKDTLTIAALLLHDKHDLMHKAVGWMLREVGKRDEAVLVDFLRKHYLLMPRTTLRYAIEKFPEEKRKTYLKGEITPL
jgi:3-methyladenine DNA glycosylase AlkD